jgi:putative ABC transport system ATP-binding protein
MYILEAQELTKVYGAGEVRVDALRGIDMRVEQGEFVAIMGPSGCGKSTLLQMLGGLETPSTGHVYIDELDLATLNDDQRTLLRRRRVGFVFQSFNLLPTLSAEENVRLPLALDRVRANIAAERATAALENVGMAHRARHLPSQLSGGEQQRVAIARALVIQPKLLLADEPTGNLDSAAGEHVTKLLRRLVDDEGQTIVMVTHDSHVAAQADRVVHLRDGVIERETCGEETLTRSPSRFPSWQGPGL